MYNRNETCVRQKGSWIGRCDSDAGTFIICTRRVEVEAETFGCLEQAHDSAQNSQDSTAEAAEGKIQTLVALVQMQQVPSK